MTIEIGSLVVRARFGGEGADTQPVDARLIERLRAQILEEVAEMLAEARRRERER